MAEIEYVFISPEYADDQEEEPIQPPKRTSDHDGVKKPKAPKLKKEFVEKACSCFTTKIKITGEGEKPVKQPVTAKTSTGCVRYPCGCVYHSTTGGEEQAPASQATTEQPTASASQ